MNIGGTEEDSPAEAAAAIAAGASETCAGAAWLISGATCAISCSAGWGVNGGGAGGWGRGATFAAWACGRKLSPSEPSKSATKSFSVLIDCGATTAGSGTCCGACSGETNSVDPDAINPGPVSPGSVDPVSARAASANPALSWGLTAAGVKSGDSALLTHGPTWDGNAFSTASVDSAAEAAAKCSGSGVASDSTETSSDGWARKERVTAAATSSST